jgi:hypothetical protein
MAALRSGVAFFFERPDPVDDVAGSIGVVHKQSTNATLVIRRARTSPLWPPSAASPGETAHKPRPLEINAHIVLKIDHARSGFFSEAPPRRVVRS